jgi:predicted ATP-grasp superfamily ATP-dependent carboligase
MTFQKGIFEKENLKLHLCNGVFEAYSASYLTTRAHMMHVSSESYNLTWVNCEMASFIHMKEGKSFFSNPYAEGMIVQALDVLDFSVIHLSAYERSSKKYKHLIWNTKADQKTKWTKIEPVKEVARLLELKNNPQKSAKNITWSEEAKNTVIIMPFLGKRSIS